MNQNIYLAVYLNGSVGGDNKTRSFVGFIVYAENSERIP